MLGCFVGSRYCPGRRQIAAESGDGIGVAFGTLNPDQSSVVFGLP